LVGKFRRNLLHPEATVDNVKEDELKRFFHHLIPHIRVGPHRNLQHKHSFRPEKRVPSGFRPLSVSADGAVGYKTGDMLRCAPDS
jgi:hypothetical protein